MGRIGGERVGGGFDQSIFIYKILKYINRERE